MVESDNPTIRVMALHALAYCERLFYLEEVEEIRLADDRVYAGRKLHEELRQKEEDTGEWTSLELSSDALGLTGKVDALRKKNGVWIPYEHKRGRSRKTDRVACAWPSDRLQVSAYGMLLEEDKGVPVEECRIRYHADNTTVRVALDEQARQDVLKAIERACELRASTTRPPVTSNDRLCIHCSLAPVCLPEEERLAENDDWTPIRLFPPDRERIVVHVTGHGSHVSRSGDTLEVTPTEGEKRVFPGNEIGCVILHGYSQISTQALHFCAGRDISVHWISGGGKYLTALAPSSGSVQRRIRQFEALCDESIRLRLARRLAHTKVETQLRYLLRTTRGAEPRSEGFDEAVETMRAALRGIASCENADALRGHEGSAARAYFSTFGMLLREDLGPELKCSGRNRRPPKDRFNALLGFGYALLYQAVMQAVIAVGLDPALGFFHTPRSSAHPLVLDVMELFRVPLWDMPTIGSLNRMQWDASADFDAAPGHVWLSAAGRKKAIELFEKRLEDKWRHPVVDYSLSYARLLELEVRLLEKEWTGSPGLFARMKLR